ncbi:tRNA uridine-5-carboxymethylaminomethyl(34) synthesis enzyme MnmG [Alistipes senegalensis]|uniref:tRNA uridine-5-carboxymethylaminomethyl(34) synthesis enzyme MnmG n=1 Tax=Alistipes senegalensis TaxID=1288121 RepID=UPI00242BDCE8|nr:tRNA uridine-5-carboxymethylaminomethyl(34) synthesis enzyme MnmG [Alistipes senegalensis]MCI7308889.1 tRNA uridine-5-carboxymethylaminomethyl(34) synthesis enzyme MnmG [Alistipes senegalensis]MDD7039204.1 tRNA uridine-5-carboxymethylaminomethyl(34) synthesis enzyme MnmG [Alistipes senegalensis]MDY2877040.1 tRNA uridine-5-carboxymethylaminomethyl(34) synthesis enzyme MnmG [Alistipes senegalensis]MDY4570593.1 tRNA uridine-5-carboxymethylaminomethyl(34) synthesis enzyme MnmG [Alistipes senegal
MTLDYDIIVIGGGHAGCEAASAAARLGSRTLLLTMDMGKMASMSCNPAVGGVAKGQIVREIDALGGQMGRITDLTTVQFRMLNRSKGAAMWSPRAQCDKTRFSEEWRHTLENTRNLYIWQDAATELLFDDALRTDSAQPDTPGAEADPNRDNLRSAAQTHRITGVRTRMGVEFTCRAVVLTSGTFLGGLMHCGASHAEGGRAGDAASHGITECLRRIGFESGRMKTGTPARLDARTIDFERLEPQYGDENPAKFSFSPDTQPVKDQLPCFLVYTSAEVHDILRSGFDQSPLFNGTIRGIGPRYCPSIEDKLRTFADKDQHQLFLEPEGRTTNEYYLNGFSSSLPWEVQWKALHKIQGFEDLHIYRPGYAIEYDYFPPTQLHHSLETKLVSGLYFAGQVNGTTGYEEAAAQGLMAGINAHRALAGEEPIVLKRDEAYIGVLIDDLVTKGVDEPYRMFTSRAEYRILLRQDNADIRLTPLGYEIGLIPQKRYDHFVKKNTLVESLVEFARRQSIKTAEINDYLKSVNSEPLTQGRKLYDILMRNNITFESLQRVLPKLKKFITDNEMSAEMIEEAEIQIKYKGYIEREKFIAEKLRRLENITIPGDFDFHSMNSLTIEARQKLSRIRPTTIGQASRIPGVSPADVNVLLIKFGR